MPRQAVKGSRWQPDKDQRSVVTVGSAVRLLQEKTQSLRYPRKPLGSSEATARSTPAKSTAPGIRARNVHSGA